MVLSVPCGSGTGTADAGGSAVEEELEEGGSAVEEELEEGGSGPALCSVTSMAAMVGATWVDLHVGGIRAGERRLTRAS